MTEEALLQNLAESATNIKQLYRCQRLYPSLPTALSSIIEVKPDDFSSLIRHCSQHQTHEAETGVKIRDAPPVSEKDSISKTIIRAINDALRADKEAEIRTSTGLNRQTRWKHVASEAMDAYMHTIDKSEANDDDEPSANPTEISATGNAANAKLAATKAAEAVSIFSRPSCFLIA